MRASCNVRSALAIIASMTKTDAATGRAYVWPRISTSDTKAIVTRQDRNLLQVPPDVVLQMLHRRVAA